jgi:hypothetical protein
VPPLLLAANTVLLDDLNCKVQEVKNAEKQRFGAALRVIKPVLDVLTVPLKGGPDWMREPAVRNQTSPNIVFKVGDQDEDEWKITCLSDLARKVYAAGYDQSVFHALYV